MRLDLKRETKKLSLQGDPITISPNTSIFDTMVYGHGYNSKTTSYIDVYVTKEILADVYEPVENLKESVFFYNLKKFVPYYPAYKHKTLDYFLIVDMDLTKESEWVEDERDRENEYQEDFYKVQTIYYKIYDVKFDEIISAVNDTMVFESPIKTKTNINLVLRNMSGFQLKEMEIKPKEIDIAKHYNDDFIMVDEVIRGSLLGDKKGIMLLHGEPGTGKLQPLTEPILTPVGYKPLGNINIGDKVLCPISGEPIDVLEIHYSSNLNIYKVTFDDGTYTECCNDHLFLIQTTKDITNDSNRVVDVNYMLENNIKSKSGRYKYSVPLNNEVHFKEKELPIHPYLLGLLLGDGYFPTKGAVVLTCNSNKVEEIYNSIINILPTGVRIRLDKQYGDVLATRIIFNSHIRELLRELGLLGKKSRDKFVPECYLYNSVENRKDILRGLMDTDGSCNIRTKSKKRVLFSTMSNRLRKNVDELVRSLGGKTYTLLDQRKKYKGGTCYNMSIKTPFNPFLLSGKHDRFKEFDFVRKFNKKIVDIKFLRKDEGRCIKVDSEHHLYITRDYTVTHNTNYIKYLTGVNRKKKFMYIPSNMIGFLTDPSFIGTMLDNKNSVLVIEDCEVYLKDRKNSNGNESFVSTLLNVSDGILSDVMDLQIICTFNNDIKDIDKAITRKGRLIAEYRFDELSQDKADRILKELGTVLDKGSKRTLANIYNSDKKVPKTKETAKIGFR